MAVRNNFRDPETGEEFYYSEHSTMFEASGKVYKYKGNQIVNPETGTPLEFIPMKRESFSTNVLQATTDRNASASKEFAAKAKKHNQSEEVADMKFKAMEKQMGTSIAEESRKVDRAKAKL